MIKDGASDSGSINTVTRVGDTVHRPANRWTPSVHTLLGHLEKVGFSGGPKLLGFDELGREILSFFSGDVAMRPWPDILLQERGLVDVGQFLARYHTAVRNYAPFASRRSETY